MLLKVADNDAAKESISAKFIPMLVKVGRDNITNRPIISDVIVTLLEFIE